MKNKELARQIENWFSKNKNNPSRWSDNEVGKIIKTMLQKSKNWKNAPRGKPFAKNSF